MQQLLDDGERGHEGNLAIGHQNGCGFAEGFPFGSVVAVPTDLALKRTARQDARPSDLALRDRGDDTAVDPAGVANGSEAGVERRAGRGEDVGRDLGGADLKREVRLDRARQTQVDVNVDQAGRHRQSLGIETLGVRAGAAESGDAAVLERDVEAVGGAP
ncbi:hypothetical protein KVH24_31985 [Streptomyces olivaceus]|nr:hypothetical protein [Streptomyces olivaceus]MBZ6173208.1 hypothetical protein [Streptomyces olivaceus]MBZ6183576.1 hypothetical protein [Streptomyces olivaceus]